MHKKPLKKNKSTLLSKILSIFIISMTGILGNAWATVCTVGSGETYTTIQSAINDLNCDTVLVQKGTYVENPAIYRDIELHGESGVVIIGDGLQTVLFINDPFGNSITATVSNVSVQNGADWLNYGGVGGGIHVSHNATVTLKTVEVIGSTAMFGGGIRNQGNLTIKDNSLIKGNTAHYGGGGIYNECQGILLVENSTISVNGATLGAGIHNCGDATLANGTVVSLNTAGSSNFPGIGGGIYNELYPGFPSSLTVNNSTISNNEAGIGSGIYSFTELTIVNGSEISSNAATTEHGGGIYHGGQVLTVRDSTISNNTAQKDGGGLYLVNIPLSMIENSEIINNTAQKLGGGIYQGQNSELHIIDGSTISDNHADLGGGIYADEGTLDPSDLLKVVNSTISDNTANDGGGIYTLRQFAFLNSTTSSNQATVYGGGLFLGPAYSLIRNSTFSANSAKAGGGLYLAGNSSEEAQANLHNTTIYENSANYGGGIGYMYATIALNHTIVAHAGGTPGEDCLAGPNGTLISEGYNLDSDDSCGLNATGDLPDAYPDLGNIADNGGYTWTHRLNSHSEARDAGNTTCGTLVDQRDKARPVNNFCDIGAFEVQQ